MTYAAAALGINVTSITEVSGGTLTSDATYYYRTFTATDNFVLSNNNLAVEYLVVAGGGAGGMGGGGGGGGVRDGSATLTPGTYLAQVGAGGSGGQNPEPSSGTSSSFNSLVSAGGGRGPYLGNAANGGSGGGGTSFGSPYETTRPATAGIGIEGQGNWGGTFSGNREYGAGGGGGGAGSAGGAATGGTSPSGTGGVGGSGTNSYLIWATATGTGANGYYAGGGGGGNNGTAINPATWSGTANISSAWTSSNGGFGQGGGAAGGAGGGGSGGARYGYWAGTQLGWRPYSFGDPRNGTVNTGGGGGGWGCFYAADSFFYQGVYYGSIGGGIFEQGQGGSGIVIIRYLKSAVGG